MSTASAEPEWIGPYRIIERIGEGGMGVVHLAVAPEGGLVAVKRLRPWLVGGEDGRARFEREVATLRRVRGPRIAEVIAADVAADPPYVVTRYVRGPALSKAVADHGPLRGAALDRLAKGLIQALASVHDAGIVHRDVKPGNVLLADDGPVLIDFGLAHAVGETRLTATGFVAGTPGYLAPETVLGKQPSLATDVHGWAATMTFAATGRPPYGTGPDVAVIDRIRRGEHDLNGLADDVDTASTGSAADAGPHGIVLGRLDLLRRAMDVDPARRPTLPELAEALGVRGVATAQARPVETGHEPATDPRAVVTAVPAPPVTSAGTAGGASSRPDDATVVLGRSVPPTRIDVPTSPPPQPPPLPPAGGPVGAPLPAGGVRPAATPAQPGPAQAGPAQPGREAERSSPPPLRVRPVQAPHPSRWQAPGPDHPYAGDGVPLRRWYSRLAVGLGAVATVLVMGVMPMVGALILVGLLILGRVVWRVRRRLYDRRMVRGPQRNDVVVASVNAPLDVLATLAPALAQGAFALGCGLIVGAALQLGELAGVLGAPRAPYLAGGAIALVLAWWGPGAGRFRHGIRVLALPLERNPRPAWVTAGVFAALSWVLVLLWDSYGTSWWPSSGPPGFLPF